MKEQQKYIDNILPETYNNNDSNKNIIEEKSNINSMLHLNPKNTLKTYSRFLELREKSLKLARRS